MDDASWQVLTMLLGGLRRTRESEHTLTPLIRRGWVRIVREAVTLTEYGHYLVRAEGRQRGEGGW